MYLRGCLESLNPELAHYGSKNECTRTNTVLCPISEVNTGAVSHAHLNFSSLNICFTGTLTLPAMAPVKLLALVLKGVDASLVVYEQHRPGM